MNENVCTYIGSRYGEGITEDSVKDLSVQDLYEELASKTLVLRAWFFPGSEVVVRTSSPQEGPLAIHIFDFRTRLDPVAIVLKKDNALHVHLVAEHRFQEPAVKAFMKAVLEMHKKLPVYDPDAVSAPPGFCAKLAE